MGAILLFPAAARRRPAEHSPAARRDDFYLCVYRHAQACDAALRIGDIADAFRQIEAILDIDTADSACSEMRAELATIAEELFQRVTARARGDEQ